MDVLIPIIAIISTIFIPVTGLMLILVSRYALKPLVETLASALRESKQAEWLGPNQVRALTEQVEDLTAEVRRLQSLQDFDRQLLGTTTSVPPAGGA
jgi:hypothetical protein